MCRQGTNLGQNGDLWCQVLLQLGDRRQFLTLTVSPTRKEKRKSISTSFGFCELNAKEDFLGSGQVALLVRALS